MLDFPRRTFLSPTRIARSLALSILAGLLAACLILPGCSGGDAAETAAGDGAGSLTREPGSIGPDRPWTAAGLNMPDRLRMISDDTEDLSMWHNAPERVAEFGKELEAATDPKAILKLRMSYGMGLIQVGRIPEALDQLDKAREMVAGMQGEQAKATEARILLGMAVAYLRQAENDNCVANHNSESCLLPIKGGGVHVAPEGSRGAIGEIMRSLELEPDSTEARWLLNLAYMTLGEYPDKVPALLLVPPSAFESEAVVPHFTNVAPGLGIDTLSRAGGSIMEDFDRDGYLDLMTTSIGFHSQMRYYRNNGDGSFTDETEQAGLTGETEGLNLFHADYDNDGYPDAFVTRGAWSASRGQHPNSLLHNNGDGTFTDVTEQAGVLSYYPTQSVAWLDFNNDGWLDLFIGNETTGANRYPCEMYLNRGDGTFTNVAAEVGLDHYGFVKAVAAADFDNDGLTDLYLSTMNGGNVLYRNDGPRTGPAHLEDHAPAAAGAAPTEPGLSVKTTRRRADPDLRGWHFEDVTRTARAPGPYKGFPVFFFDYDNDGFEDLFVCSRIGRDAPPDVDADGSEAESEDDPLKVVVDNYYLGRPLAMEPPTLYHNNGDGTFTDVTAAMRLDRPLLGMSANYGDIDNDGFLDFYLGTGNPGLYTLIPNLMFRNAGGRRFQDVTSSGGFGNLQKGHGIAFGDIDNDGDQDIYMEMGGAWQSDVANNMLLLNPGNGNHWVTLLLEGVESNRFGVGSRIRVVVATPRGEREIHVTTGTGGSFGSSSLQQEIGLGDAKSIRRIEIFWPATGRTQVIEKPPMDRFLAIREGGEAATVVTRTPVPIPLHGPATHEHHHPVG